MFREYDKEKAMIKRISEILREKGGEDEEVVGYVRMA